MDASFSFLFLWALSTQILQPRSSVYVSVIKGRRGAGWWNHRYDKSEQNRSLELNGSGTWKYRGGVFLLASRIIRIDKIVELLLTVVGLQLADYPSCPYLATWRAPG
jgi:hypothetical protein